MSTGDGIRRRDPNLSAILGFEPGGVEEPPGLPRDVLARVEEPGGTRRLVLTRPVEDVLKEYGHVGPDGVRLVDPASPAVTAVREPAGELKKALEA